MTCKFKQETRREIVVLNIFQDKKKYDIFRLKGIIASRARNSLNGGSLEIMSSDHLNMRFKFITMCLFIHYRFTVQLLHIQ